MSFDHLGLAPELVRAVADEGYTEPTPVQHAAIPVVLEGRDLLAAAQTGTGKTAAFVLPILQRLATAPAAGGHAAAPDASGRHPSVRALVLAPTRELALQVEESVRTYGRHRPVRSVAIHGGVGYAPQIRALRSWPGIVVATPGRLLDHVAQGTIDLGGVEILVLDEADRMLDMGFIRDIRRVIELLPRRRQNLLFSATFSPEIRSLAEGLLDRPATVEVAPRNAATELVEQLVIPVDRHRKQELLVHLIRTGRVERALVFARTKHGANRLSEQLARDGVRSAAIHGNKSQGQRIRALEDFRAGRVDVLVATDIAARGIDIDALPHVVNHELPMVAADYVHRIGRTGRAGVGGRAVSLVCVDEAGLLRDVERFLGRRLPTEVVEGFEPDRTIRPEPIRLRSGDAGRARPRGAAPPRRRTAVGCRAPRRRTAARVARVGSEAGGRAPGGRAPGRPRRTGPPAARVRCCGAPLPVARPPAERRRPGPCRSAAAECRSGALASRRRAGARPRRPAHAPRPAATDDPGRADRPGDEPAGHVRCPGRGLTMARSSRFEREKRAAEQERVRQIEAAWRASTPAEVARTFAREVEAARARGPQPPRPDMAPGTAPNPPRPGREPKPPKAERRGRRSY